MAVVAVVGLENITQIVVQDCCLQQYPKFGAAIRATLIRVKLLDLIIFIDQLGQFGQLPIGSSAGHRRRHMVDDHGMAAALGLIALAWIVDDKRINHWQIADQWIGVSIRGSGQRSCRAAIRACHVCPYAQWHRLANHHAASDRAHNSCAAVANRADGKSRWGPYHSHAAAAGPQIHCQTPSQPKPNAPLVQIGFARRFAPLLHHAQLGGTSRQFSKPVFILLDRHMHRLGLVALRSAMSDHTSSGRSSRVRVGRWLRAVRQQHSPRLSWLQQTQQRGWCIQAHGIADARGFGAAIGKDKRDPFFSIGFVAQRD